jgi:hypothetical protein
VGHPNCQGTHFWARRDGDKGGMVVGTSSDEGIGEREGLKRRREAGDGECRHEWCREKR